MADAVGADYSNRLSKDYSKRLSKLNRRAVASPSGMRERGTGEASDEACKHEYNAGVELASPLLEMPPHTSTTTSYHSGQRGQPGHMERRELREWRSWRKGPWLPSADTDADADADLEVASHSHSHTAPCESTLTRRPHLHTTSLLSHRPISVCTLQEADTFQEAENPKQPTVFRGQEQGELGVHKRSSVGPFEFFITSFPRSRFRAKG